MTEELKPNEDGRVEIGPDHPLYKAFRPSPETIDAIEKVERANAQALAAIRDMMIGHVTNWPEPKKFGTAIALVDKTLHAALSERSATLIETDEMMEMAAEALLHSESPRAQWPMLLEAWSAKYRHMARAALSAVIPHVRASRDREIVNAIRATMCDCSGKFIANALEAGQVPSMGEGE